MSNFIRIATKFDVIAEEMRSWCKDSLFDLDGVERVDEGKIEWKFCSIYGLDTTVTLTKDSANWSSLKIVSEVGFVRKSMEMDIRAWIEHRNSKKELGTRMGINGNGSIQLNYICDGKTLNHEAITGLLDAVVAEGHKMARILKTDFDAGPLRW